MASNKIYKILRYEYSFPSKVYIFNSFIVTESDLVYIIGHMLYLGLYREVTEPTIIPELCNKQIIEFKNGFSHCIARSIDGKLYSFGSNECKQLGYKTDNKYNNSPKIIENLINENVIQVSCGEKHTIVLTKNGEVFGWGDNSCGQIRIDSEEKVISIPTKIIGFNGEKIQSISCVRWHSMALTVNGNVFSWFRCLDDLEINITCNSCVPQIIQMKDKSILFKKISCGLKYSLLLSTNGDIYLYYYNDYNQMGYKTNENYSSIPRKIETNGKIKFSDIFSHPFSSVSIAIELSDNFCYVWGQMNDDEVIDSPKKTDYKSCEDLMINIINKNKSNEKACNDFDYNFNNRFIIEFTKVEHLSSGGYGEVFKAKKISNNKMYAIKRIPIEREINEKTLKEIEILSKLKSEFTVDYEKSWIENNSNSLSTKINKMFLYIQMELCLKTLEELKQELYEELNCNKSLRDSVIGFYIMSELIKEVIEGVNYLHKNKIIHRDLKPQNILITECKNGRIVKIADFGISCIHETKFVNNEFTGISHTGDVGDDHYMAPELIKWSDRDSSRLLYDEKVDIYSLAVIFGEIFFDFKFGKISLNLINLKIETMFNFISKMKSKEPEIRPSCQELLDFQNNYLMNLIDLNNFIKYNNNNLSENFHFNKYKFHLINGRYSSQLIENYLCYEFLERKSLSKCDLLNYLKELITLIIGEEIIDLKNGLDYIIFQSISRKLYSFGSDKCKQLGYKIENGYNFKPKMIESLINENVIQVICGVIHTIVLTKNGEVFGWGHNSWNQIGINSKENFISIPTKIIGFNCEKIQSISCGGWHSMALTVKGNVFSWGDNSYGQLGINGKEEFISIPTKIIGFNCEKIQSISCGRWHSMALTVNGNVFSWGDNHWGQLAINSEEHLISIPTKIIRFNGEKIQSIICGGHYSLALTVNGNEFDFGR